MSQTKQKQGKWVKGVWYPSKIAKDITIAAKDYKELIALRNSIDTWKGYIKEQKDYESEIRSLAQKKEMAAKKEENTIKDILK